MMRRTVAIAFAPLGVLVLVMAESFWDAPQLASGLANQADASVSCGAAAPTPAPAKPAAPDDVEEEVEIRADTRPRPRPFYPNNLANRFGQSDSTATSALPGVNEPEGPHDYFNRLAGRPDLMCAYSMRSQSQIDQYRAGNVPGANPPTYDSAADAMKIVVGANKGSIEIKDQVHFPIDATPGDAYLLTWDTWFGPEFFTEAGGGFETQKWIQIQVNEPGEDRWWEHRMRYAYSSGLPEVARYDSRLYRSPIGNMTDQHPIAPMETNFMVHASTWTRHWMLMEPDGANYQVTVWVADEKRNAVKVFDQLDVAWPSTNINNFETVYNSSQSRTGGPMISYMRNLVMLKDPSNVISLLVSP